MPTTARIVGSGVLPENLQVHLKCVDRSLVEDASYAEDTVNGWGGEGGAGVLNSNICKGQII